MKVLVIGAGNMGLTYGASIGQSGYLDKEDLMIYDKSTEVVEKLREKNNPNYEVYDDLEECLPISDIIFIAVKPYHNDALMEEMKPISGR